MLIDCFLVALPKAARLLHLIDNAKVQIKFDTSNIFHVNNR